MLWEIRSKTRAVHLNIGKYSAIYNENDTHEEEFLNDIYEYFQPRAKNKEEVLIIDLDNNEHISNKSFRSFILSQSVIEEEHCLSASSLMYKKLVRDYTMHIETDGYINSINALMEDMLIDINQSLPLELKKFDVKQLIKQLSFEYDYSVDYSKLINKLVQLLPILVTEMNAQSLNKTLIIYLYPEANLSPVEQQSFASMLKELDAHILVLTQSKYFLADELKYNNYFRNGKQMLSDEFYNSLEWEAPLDYKEEELMERLDVIFKNYCNDLEIQPIISNYRLADIVVFDSIDIYVVLSWLKHCKHNYTIDIELGKLPSAISTFVNKML